MTPPKPKGGARKGAGRKPTDDPAVKVTITLKRALRDKFLALGGSKWLAVKVEKEVLIYSESGHCKSPSSSVI